MNSGIIIDLLPKRCCIRTFAEQPGAGCRVVPWAFKVRHMRCHASRQFSLHAAQEVYRYLAVNSPHLGACARRPNSLADRLGCARILASLSEGQRH